MNEKHARVADTLLEGEHPLFVLDAADREPLETPTRRALDWTDHQWIETDPATGIELGRGAYEQRGTR